MPVVPEEPEPDEPVSQLRKLERALALVRPVSASLKERRPQGVPAWNADTLARHVSHAADELAAAIEVWGVYEQKRKAGA